MIFLNFVKSHLILLILSIVLLLSSQVAFSVDSQDWITKGIEAFKSNNDEQAILFFNHAANENPDSVQVQLLLGLTYHRAEKYQQAEDAYSKGIMLSQGKSEDVYFRRGNLRWSMGNFEGALNDYTTVEELGGKLVSAAILNKANLQLELGMYRQALYYYKSYLYIEDNIPNRRNIEKIINLIQLEIDKSQQEEIQQKKDNDNLTENKEILDSILKSILDSLNEIDLKESNSKKTR